MGIRRIGVIAVGLLLAAGSVRAQPGGPARVVVTPVLEQEVARTTSMVGAVDFDRRAGLSVEVGGLIRWEALSEGMVVPRGAALVELNTDFIRQNIVILERQIEVIDVRIANTDKNVRRLATLLEEEAASQRTYDDLVGNRDALIKQKEGLLAQVEKHRLEIGKSRLMAPFEGLILERFKSVGEWVAPGTAVCTLGSTSDVVVQVAVPEEIIRYVGTGGQVSLKLNALDQTAVGTIRGLVPVADTATKTFMIKIAIPYQPGIIQNMSATVDVPVSAKVKMRLIPRDALVRHQGNVLVYTVADGKARVLPLRVAGYRGSFAGVVDPHIQAGMPVVVEGNERLRPDQPVEVVERATGPPGDSSGSSSKGTAESP